MPVPNPLRDTDSEKVMLQAEQLRMHHVNLPYEVGGSMLGGLVLAAVQWQTVSHLVVLGWVLLLACVHGARILNDVHDQRTGLERVDRTILLRRAHGHSIALGVTWGLSGLLLFSPDHIEHQTFLALVLVGMSAAWLTIAALDLVAVFIFNFLTLTPMIVRLVMEGGAIQLAMAMMGALFLGFTTLIALRAHGNARENVALRQSDAVKAQALQRSETGLRTLLDAFPGFITCFNSDLCFTYANERYAALLGLTPEQIVGRSMAELLGTDRADSVRAYVKRVRAGERVTFEARYEATSNSPSTDMQVTLVAGLDHLTGTPVCYAFSTDVSDRKRAEDALHVARDAAEAASRAKSEFLASMSHELRTPLNAILGFSQLFGMDPDLPQNTKDNAQEIERAGQHLLSLVNDLIDLARIEAGKLEISLEPVSLASLFQNSLALVAPIASKQHIQLIDEGGDGQGATVRADYVRLRQILINLLSNAIKYNRPEGGVYLSCQRRPEQGTVRISVRDTGHGMTADQQDRIFNAFDRLGAERGHVEGTGIGLVITQRLVMAMGGQIGFESSKGQGSTFWVEFPLCAPVGHPSLQEAVSVAGATPAGEPVEPGLPLILYIEDNPMNLRLMHQIFSRRLNLELRDADNADTGIALARSLKPDLILLDINLPGMSGYEALKILKADPQTAGIPVIGVSANAMQGDEARALAAGFASYVTKPIDVPLFLATIDTAITTRLA